VVVAIVVAGVNPDTSPRQPGFKRIARLP